MTMQDIVGRLNQMTLHYNLSWDNIKYDVDRAITRINTHLGARYPMMTDILKGPGDTYSINQGGIAVPIFPEEYIHSIVIPFVAMEVLARDEEFTTIYNKYSMDVEDGLFTMFEKEFNRVPLAFRQQPDAGVFFASDSALGRIKHNELKDLPVYKFKITYAVNEPSITSLVGSFIHDTRAYLYNDSAIVKGWNKTLYSQDGTVVFKFKGWAGQTSLETTNMVLPGATLCMTSDVTLYAIWESESTLHIEQDGTVWIKDDYIQQLQYLKIPDKVNNIFVTKIRSYFLRNLRSNILPDELADVTDINYFCANQLQTVVLPAYINTIEANAFDGGVSLTNVALAETDIGTMYTYGEYFKGIAIGTNAFANTPRLTTIYLPANIVTINLDAFPIVNSKNLDIFCAYLEVNHPLANFVDGVFIKGYHPSWYASSDTSGGSNYTVAIKWGYNV